ncbi:hypothetical protein MMC07_008745 [Pseudocyphellaria aurata]|nr:hypothetical protein [Pseudocyphellaria aurata]
MNVTSTDDDLDITKVVRKDFGKDKYVHKTVGPGSETESDVSDEQDVSKRPRMHDAHAEGEKVDWSDGDSDEAYNKFKNRKAVKRKQVAAKNRKVKAMEKDLAGAKGSKKRKRDDNIKDQHQKRRDYGDDSDDDLMEHTLPEYLQNRRAKFDKRVEMLKQSGLKLPPSYDDVEFSDDERLKDLIERPDFPRRTAPAKYKDKPLPTLGLIPAPIAQWLRDYQVEGTAFLHSLFVYQTGGVLGDDMGLGKTVQVIAFLTAAFGKTGDERDSKRMRKKRRAGTGWYPRVLIVCPGTLIENWKSELRRWGWWHVDVFHGDMKEGAIQSAKAGRIEIMITTYTTYRINKSTINLVEWDCVVADECHIIKGRKSETTEAMNEVNALCRIGLTGTAIQNSYDELWTLLNWTNPGKFGPISTWKTSISIPLKMGQSHDATVHQLSTARKTAKALVENLLPRFFLRRMKSIIADQLPKKNDRVVFCPLTDTQSDAYVNFIESDVIQYIKTSGDLCSCGSGKRSGWCCHTNLPDGGKWQSYVFPAIMNLQKLSNHLAVLIPQSNDPKEKQDKDLEMLQIAVPDQWRELYRSRDSILNYTRSEFCGKWKILKKLLQFWHANGDKVLVFSHNVRLLKILQMLFNVTSYNVSYLDGSMTYEDRAKTVDDFNSDPGQFVFLISTKAGGVGLNITSANKVVVFDPNWNPAYDLQAQDRAYRIGQSRDVEVFRLVSAGTIEEIVYARQIYKQQQANIGYTASNERRYFKGIQEDKYQKGEIFGLANLFAFEGDNIVLRNIVNKTNVAEAKAGVAVVGLDLETTADEDFLLPSADADGLEEEDAAMSQLAALVAAGGDPETEPGSKRRRKTEVKKSDPVQAILAGAGVEYTHENDQVVGSSKVEASLSRRAQEMGDDLDPHGGNQHVFAATQDPQPAGDEDDSDVLHALDDDPAFNENDDDGEDDDDLTTTITTTTTTRSHRKPQPPTTATSTKQIQYRYHPPPAVMRRQLCTMARTFGFPDPCQFALVVESWTQAQRRCCLDKFYRARRLKLAASGAADGGGDGRGDSEWADTLE